MDLSCPVCETETKGDGEPFGSPQSVEAHISASRDDAHRGKQGQDFRAEIVGGETAGSNVSQADGDASTTPANGQGDRDHAGDDNGQQNGSHAVDDDDILTVDVHEQIVEQERREGYEEGRADGLEEASAGMVPEEHVEGLDAENVALAARVEELEAQVEESGEIECPYCQEPTGKTEGELAGSHWDCGDCGGTFEVTAGP